jgi:hypothetical protein
VKDLVTGIVGQRDTVSISEHLRLIDAKAPGDLTGILLGLSIVFANMTHPIMCRRATDQVKEISGHVGSTATSSACSKGSAFIVRFDTAPMATTKPDAQTPVEMKRDPADIALDRKIKGICKGANCCENSFDDRSRWAALGCRSP